MSIIVFHRIAVVVYLLGSVSLTVEVYQRMGPIITTICALGFAAVFCLESAMQIASRCFNCKLRDRWQIAGRFNVADSGTSAPSHLQDFSIREKPHGRVGYQLAPQKPQFRGGTYTKYGKFGQRAKRTRASGNRQLPVPSCQRIQARAHPVHARVNSKPGEVFHQA